MPPNEHDDTAPVSDKLNLLTRLTGIRARMSSEERTRRDVASGLARVRDGIETLRRLPGTEADVVGFRRDLAYLEQVEDLAQAKLLIKQTRQRLKVAIARGEAARKEADRLLNAQAEARRKVLADEIRFQALRDRLSARLKTIENEPLTVPLGLGAQIDAVIKLRDDADDLLAARQASRAVAMIAEAVDGAEDIIRTWNSLVADMHKSRSRLIKKTTAYYQEYKAAAVLSQAEQEALCGEMDALVIPLAKNPRRKDKSLVLATEELVERHHAQALETIAERQQELEAARGIVPPAVERTRHLLEIALGRQITELLRQAIEAEHLLEQREYARATVLAREVNVLRGALEPDLVLAHSAWQQNQKSVIPGLFSDIGTQRNLEGEPPFRFPHDPAALGRALSAVEEGVLDARTCAEANDELGVIKAQIDENSRLLLVWQGLAAARARLDRRVQAAADRTRAEIALLGDEMKRVMATRDDPPADWAPHDAGGLTSKLETALADWLAVQASATTEDQLSADEILSRLDTIEQLADLAQFSDGGLNLLVDKDLLAAAEARFATAEAVLVAGLPQWAVYPIPSHDLIVSRLADARAELALATGAEQVNAAAARLEALGQQARSETSTITGLLDYARRALRERVDAARVVVEALRVAAGKHGILDSSSVTAVRQQCLQEATQLAEQIDTIAGRHTSDLLDVFEQGTVALTKIEARAQALQAICKTGKEGVPPQLPDTFKALLKTRRTSLKNKDLKRFRPSDRYLLDKDLEAIEARLGDGEHTTRIQSSIDAWDQQLEDALALAARDKAELHLFEQLHAVVVALLQENKALFASHKDFYKKLKADLKGAREQAKAEDGIRGADATVRGAKADLERVVMAATEEGEARGLKLSDELEQGQAGALAAQHRAAKQEAEWLARWGAFRERWLPELPLGATDVHKLLTLAEKSADRDPPDYEAAKRYLDMAAERAQLAISFPDGPQAMSLGRLPVAARDWVAAVGRYRDSFSALRGHFGTLDDPAKTALLAGVDELKGMFDPNAFSPIVQKICNSGGDKASRGQAREDGLARVRRYREALVKDSRFRQLQAHPFDGVDAWHGAFTIQQPLIELERLLLMSVPTS